MASRTALEHKDGKLHLRVQMPVRRADLGRLMADKEQPRKPIPEPDTERAEELRRVVREDIEEQRKFIEKIKRKMN